MTTSNKQENRKKTTLNKRKCITTMLSTSMMLLLLMTSTVPLLIDAAAQDRRSRKMRDIALNREVRERIPWSKENEKHSDKIFFRLFRMKQETFQSLCERIKKAVGPATFKSEYYLQWLTEGEGSLTRQGILYRNCREHSGDYVSGEWKVAMALRYLSGATYFDLYLWSSINPDYTKDIVNDVIQNWFCNDGVFKINFYEDVLLHKANNDRIRREFSSKTEGIMNGCIGAVDGWLVKIRAPTMNEVPNPGKYFSRKNVYGLNIQVIVDKRKRVLWRHIGEVGSSHDSQVFHDSRLGKHLQREREYLSQQNMYIIGDSAYALRNYLLCPYDNATPKSLEDSFNYFLSSARIYVECCFGEIDRRWGILWGPIEGHLSRKKYIIDACIRLHNYIVEERELEKRGIHNEFDDIEILDQSKDEFILKSPFASSSFVRWADTLNTTLRTLQHQEENEEELRREGKILRDEIKNLLWNKGFRRPDSSLHDACVRDRHNRVVTVNEE